MSFGTCRDGSFDVHLASETLERFEAFTRRNGRCVTTIPNRWEIQSILRPSLHVRYISKAQSSIERSSFLIWRALRCIERFESLNVRCVQAHLLVKVSHCLSTTIWDFSRLCRACYQKRIDLSAALFLNEISKESKTIIDINTIMLRDREWEMCTGGRSVPTAARCHAS